MHNQVKRVLCEAICAHIIEQPDSLLLELVEFLEERAFRMQVGRSIIDPEELDLVDTRKEIFGDQLYVWDRATLGDE